MNSGIQKIRIFNLRPNKCSWIILSAIAFSLLIISCAPHSVRNSKSRSLRHPVKEQIIEKTTAGQPENIDSKQLPEMPIELANELNIANTNKSDTFYLDEKSGEVIPYNSHLRAIIEEQDNINRKVSSLQTDVADIKNTLEMIKTELMVMNSKPPEDAVAGEDATGNSTPKNNSNIMLPDEKVNLKTERKQNTAKKQVKPKTRNRIITTNKNTEEPDEDTPVDFSSNDTKPQDNQAETEPFNGFNKAMNEFKNRNYKGAINELHNMLKKEKNKDNIGKYNYWIGESHFGLNQYDKAVNYFEKVLSSNNTAKKDDAQIMIAESHARTGNIEEAKKAFGELITNYPKSRYIPRARKMLQQM